MIVPSQQEPTTPTEPATATPAAASQRAARTGRRIAGALYVVLVVYVIGAGFVSAVPQIFWPGVALGIPQIEPRHCTAEIEALRTDLLSTAGRHVREPGAEPLRPFLDPWDERYRALEASCGALPSYGLLARLRYRVEEHLLRFEADVASLDEDTRRAIEADARP